jgi:hypothetical protein
MKPKKPRRFIPPLGGVSYPHFEMTESIDHYPITGKTTRLKWDRASGTLIVDPDQPKGEETQSADKEIPKSD